MSEQRRLWSVTEIIDMATPKPWLAGWAVRETVEYAVDQRAAWLALAEADRDGAVKLLKDVRWRTAGRAADRGTALHAYSKALALGAPPPPSPPEAVAHMEQFEQFLRDYRPKYVAAEAPVYHLGYSYAGTLDAIVEIDGRTCVLDYKTTDKGPEAEYRPPYQETGMQLAAYARAELLGLPGSATIQEQRRRRYYTWDTEGTYTPMPATDGGLCLMLSPVDYALHPMRIDDTVWNSFLHAREVARWVLEVSRTVVGPALVPPNYEAALIAEAEQLAVESGGRLL